MQLLTTTALTVGQATLRLVGASTSPPSGPSMTAEWGKTQWGRLEWASKT